MKEFFASMDTTQQVYWYIAIGASVIFIIQTIMTFIGADSDGGVDADFDGDLDGAEAPFQLFSLRNLVNFLLGFGWTGVAFYGTIGNSAILGIVAALVGILFIAIFFFIMRTLMRFAEDNSFNIDNTVGKTGDVYTTIPAKMGGKGKVLVSVNGSTHELPAVTIDEEPLKAGTLIKVLEVKENMLVVTILK